MVINIGLVLILFLFNSQFTHEAKPKGIYCSTKEFQCLQSAVCIPLERKCDGIHDCIVLKPINITDLSDERDCPCNKSVHFTCYDGSCISLGFTCDGVNDCGDGSDERFCKSCNADEFRCATGQNYCIPLEKKCDGVGDCKDHSDEMNCTHSTASGLSTSIIPIPDKSSEEAQSDSISPTTEEISIETYDVFSIPVPQINESGENINRTKKSTEMSEDGAIPETTKEEIHQNHDNKPEVTMSCSTEKNHELKIFFASICEGTIALSNERQLRVRKVIAEIILKMTNEEENRTSPVTSGSTYYSSAGSLYPVDNSVPKFENGIFFPPSGGYLTAFDRFMVGKNFVIGFEIKPRSKDGILVAAYSRNHFFILQMIAGSIKVTVNNGNGPLYTSFKPQNASYLYDNRWHSIKALKTKTMTILVVDDQGTNFGVDPNDGQLTDNTYPLYIGGFPSDFVNAEGIEANTRYIGCMRNFEINERSYELTSFNAYERMVLHGCPVV